MLGVRVRVRSSHTICWLLLLLLRWRLHGRDAGAGAGRRSMTDRPTDPPTDPPRSRLTSISCCCYATVIILLLLLLYGHFDYSNNNMVIHGIFTSSQHSNICNLPTKMKMMTMLMIACAAHSTECCCTLALRHDSVILK